MILPWYFRPRKPPKVYYCECGMGMDDDKELCDVCREREEKLKSEEMKDPWPDNHKGHWWSGWPGAYCMRCGADHYLEYALGMGWYDPVTDKWDTEEHRLENERAELCPADSVH